MSVEYRILIPEGKDYDPTRHLGAWFRIDPSYLEDFVSFQPDLAVARGSRNLVRLALLCDYSNYPEFGINPNKVMDDFDKLINSHSTVSFNGIIQVVTIPFNPERRKATSHALTLFFIKKDDSESEAVRMKAFKHSFNAFLAKNFGKGKELPPFPNGDEIEDWQTVSSTLHELSNPN